MYNAPHLATAAAGAMVILCILLVALGERRGVRKERNRQAEQRRAEIRRAGQKPESRFAVVEPLS